MVEENICEMVRRSPLAQDLGEAGCQILSDIATIHVLNDSDILFEEGHTDNTVHIIAEGKLAVTKTTGAGESTILHVLQGGDLAGEMAFIDGTPHSATLKAIGDTAVISLEREAFERLLGDHPQVVYAVMRTIVRTVHNTLRRMNAQYVEMANYITRSHGRY